MRRITGYDPATGHAEPGWAIEIGFDEAVDLGLRFQQDAIFWVSGKPGLGGKVRTRSAACGDRPV